VVQDPSQGYSDKVNMAFVNAFNQALQSNLDVKSKKKDDEFRQKELNLRERQIRDSELSRQWQETMANQKRTDDRADVAAANKRQAQLDTISGIQNGTLQSSTGTSVDTGIPGVAPLSMPGPPGQSFDFGAGPVTPVPFASRQGQLTDIEATRTAAVEQAKLNTMRNSDIATAQSLYGDDPAKQKEFLTSKWSKSMYDQEHKTPDITEYLMENMKAAVPKIGFEKAFQQFNQHLTEHQKAMQPYGGANAALAGAEVKQINANLQDKADAKRAQQIYGTASDLALRSGKLPKGRLDPNFHDVVSSQIDHMLGAGAIKPDEHAAAQAYTMNQKSMVQHPQFNPFDALPAQPGTQSPQQ
jgi:hypothetical protein